jgi:hypothetical protein
MTTMTARRRRALVVAALALFVVVFALVAAAFAALPVAIAVAAAVFALAVGIRSRTQVTSRPWRPPTAGRSTHARWAAAGAPPALDGPSWTTTWDTLPSPSVMPAVRERAAAVLTEWDLRGEAAQPSLLALTELLTNAIEHAGPPLRVTLELGADFVRVEVHDCTPRAPRSHPRADGCGRGLEIVAALSLRHGWTPDAHGKIVWADIPHGWPE